MIQNNQFQTIFWTLGRNVDSELFRPFFGRSMQTTKTKQKQQTQNQQTN